MTDSLPEAATRQTPCVAARGSPGERRAPCFDDRVRGEDVTRSMHPRHAISLTALAASVAATAGCAGNDQSTLHPAGTDAQDIGTLWWVMFVGAAVVLAVVMVLVALVVLRRRGVRDAPDLSPQSRAAAWLPVVGGIVVPAVVLAGLFALTLGTLSSTTPASAGP